MSLRWAHSHFVGFVMSRLTLSMKHFHCEDKKRDDACDCQAEYVRVSWAVTTARFL